MFSRYIYIFFSYYYLFLIVPNYYQSNTRVLDFNADSIFRILFTYNDVSIFNSWFVGYSYCLYSVYQFGHSNRFHPFRFNICARDPFKSNSLFHTLLLIWLVEKLSFFFRNIKCKIIFVSLQLRIQNFIWKRELINCI